MKEKKRDGNVFLLPCSPSCFLRKKNEREREWGYKWDPHSDYLPFSSSLANQTHRRIYMLLSLPFPPPPSISFIFYPPSFNQTLCYSVILDIKQLIFVLSFSRLMTISQYGYVLKLVEYMLHIRGVYQLQSN